MYVRLRRYKLKLRRVSQSAAVAPIETKIRLAFLATALSDALGASTEFQRRFSFDFVTSMLPNDSFSQPKGVWTDDTSMTLCLAKSIAQVNGFDPIDQLSVYCKWWPGGYLSAVPRPFDIGNTISRALYLYHQHRKEEPDNILSIIKREHGSDAMSGNGSLMRLIPIPLAYWRLSEPEAQAYARRMSETTHPSAMCVEICEMWTATVRHVLNHTCVEGAPPLTKLDILHFVSTYPYTHPRIKAALAGFVVASAHAALYCFLASENFEDGAIIAANLGNDSDTVAAIYAGLAGVWYAKTEDVSANDAFWSDRVREWKADLVNEKTVREVAEDLVGFSQSQTVV
ncbi:ADP-ribosylation/Crystallin J1 [Flagelloscypha sp. PMI_526]|nr:ADP-ribosylation/Crystallin J1 [Flagelloscypha sp. PMI_526]